MLPEGTIQCQALLSNRQQCALPAILKVNSTPFCRLHLNWIVGEGTVIEGAKLEIINESEKDEVNKILSGTADDTKARKI